MENLNKSETIAVNKCMEILANAVMKLDTNLEKQIYGQFQDLINETFGTQINYNVTGDNIFEFDTKEEMEEFKKKWKSSITL